MTFSDAWIESPEDPDFEKFLSQSKPSRGLPKPYPSNNYWINLVKNWAEKNRLEIQYPDYLEVRVSVSKDQLLKFLDDMFSAGEPVSHLRNYIENKCKENISYIIVADEL